VRKERSHEFVDLKKNKVSTSKKPVFSSKKNEEDVYEGFEKVTTKKQVSIVERDNIIISNISVIENENYQKLDDDKESPRTPSEKSSEINIGIEINDKVQNNNINDSSSVKERVLMLWHFIRKKEIYKPIFFILAFSASPSYDDSMFFFYTSVLGFDEIMIGRLFFFAAVASVVGVALYKKWLSKYGFKCIMFSSTTILAILGLIAIALTQRWNTAIGIPDSIFCLTASSMVTALSEINTMPLLILAANLCPKNIEGMTYALLMSVINLGGFLSLQMGSVLTSWLGITSTKFDNLWLLILLGNLFSLLPLPLLFCVDDIKQEPPPQATTVEEENNSKARS
jgi:Na+/melibiose symporter-like transporter